MNGDGSIFDGWYEPIIEAPPLPGEQGGRQFPTGIYDVLQEALKQVPRIIQATKGLPVAEPSKITILGPVPDPRGVGGQFGLSIPGSAFPQAGFGIPKGVAPSLIPGIPDLWLAVGIGLIVLVAVVK